MNILLVGGAVRDKLLNYPVYDRDWVVVGATVEQMLKLNYQAVGKEFPVFLHPKTKEEYALARTERKSGHGYKGFEFYASPEVTLEQDLQRRDLTINAMAEDRQGNIFDPYGGQKDLAARLLRHVSPAFSEDPLRVLRVARFAARFKHLGFSVARETIELMASIARSGELKHLTPERVWAELERALTENSPERFFLVLEQSQALAELFPEIQQILSSPVREQALTALKRSCQLTDTATARFATLCYFIKKSIEDSNQHKNSAAKARQNKDQSRGNGNNIDKEDIPRYQAILQSMLERLKAPNEYKALCLLVQQRCDQLLEINSLSTEEKLRLYEGLDIQRRPQRLPLFLICARAIAKWSSRTDSFNQEQALQQLRDIIEAIQPREIAAAGFKGKALGTELRNRRLQAIDRQTNLLIQSNLFNGPDDSSYYFLFAHGAGAGMEHSFMESVAHQLGEKGIRVIRFEFPYMLKTRETGKRRPPDRAPKLLEAFESQVKELLDSKQNSNPSQGGVNKPDIKLVIGGKSMGGRFASLLAAEQGKHLGIDGVICLGFPFHPQGKPERYRGEHLHSIQIPTLIIQGERDSFGTREEVESYPTSPDVCYQFLEDGDHSFKPRKASGFTEQQHISSAVEAMAEFIKKL
ncbi:multifunctional CCA addition/repair protein [Motiliproteus sp. MSK22-1]|uniref:multifunctional CCA addition/repair protein n=1 Tax=Motiliproteus sp. MSK22-1 TaxID=1897630 RepID=UPI0009784BBC|nr:multifunctional CCA addition/repair protein [Motiliproteus sp. MSK22-1]OMH32152.1 hypothetical protein BGP75_15765 [Motiliproteus sp. MSK22-1]